MTDVGSNVLHNLMRYITFISDTYININSITADIHFPLPYFSKIQKYNILLETSFVSCWHSFLAQEHRPQNFKSTVEKCMFCIRFREPVLKMGSTKKNHSFLLPTVPPGKPLQKAILLHPPPLGRTISNNLSSTSPTALVCKLTN